MAVAGCMRMAMSCDLVKKTAIFLIIFCVILFTLVVLRDKTMVTKVFTGSPETSAFFSKSSVSYNSGLNSSARGSPKTAVQRIQTSRGGTQALQKPVPSSQIGAQASRSSSATPGQRSGVGGNRLKGSRVEVSQQNVTQPVQPGAHAAGAEEKTPKGNSKESKLSQKDTTLEQGVRGNFPPIEVVVQSKKTILYLCNHFGCGGLADRQKGIVSAFVLAAMLKRRFKIHVTVPCDLATNLSPNITDWKTTDEEINRADHYHNDVIDEAVVTYMKNVLKKDDLDSQFPHEMTSFRWNMEVVQFMKEHRLGQQIPWLRDLSVPDIYKHVLTSIFTLHPDIQRDLQTLRDSVQSNLICAQIRLGGTQSSFTDSQSYYTADQAFPAVSSFFKSYASDEKSRFLLTSDSEQLTKMADTAFLGRTLKLPGPITHVDKTKGSDACQGVRKAILDEYALAFCDRLLISESGLGLIGAFLRGTDRHLFLFLGSKIVPYKRFDPFPDKGW